MNICSKIINLQGHITGNLGSHIAANLPRKISQKRAEISHEIILNYQKRRYWSYFWQTFMQFDWLRLLLFMSDINEGLFLTINGIKMWVFFWKFIGKKHLCRHDKSYYYFWISNIPGINLSFKKYEFLKKYINSESRFHQIPTIFLLFFNGTEFWKV